AVGGVEAALAAIEAAPPHVVISDIAMPDADGYTLIRRIRGLDGERARIPAVALTAHARADDRRRALMAGFQVHLAKPIDPAELAAVVVNLARLGR
ncbi:MAG: response regulator, partial [Candidatus Rokuibacteriota bacterium]